MNDKLNELADRCEQATAPDRELDAAIARAIGFGCVAQDHQAPGDHWTAWKGKQFRSGPWEPLKLYTASLDAAMTLVPEGHRLVRLAEEEGVTERPWHIRLVEREGRFGRLGYLGDANTPALAICAATLRARAAQERSA
jgi:hypothetical protein